MISDPQLFVQQNFSYAHLPQHLQVVSMSFYNLASSFINRRTNTPTSDDQLSDALWHLLRAKDSAVRAQL